MKPYRQIVIKIGSNVVAKDNGLPDEVRMDSIVEQVVKLRKMNKSVVLVSSGAVAFGRSVISSNENIEPVAARQQLAAVGQVKLMSTYSEIFRKHNVYCAQVLVTKEDFRDRRHYLNMKSCVGNLLKSNIVPIVNENDVVAVTELMFTDNDELSGLAASMLRADALIILTSVDGLYNGEPGGENSQVIPVIDSSEKDFSFITPGKSGFGRGGMLTKSKMALKLAQVGITVHIANGKTDNVLLKIMKGEETGTVFLPKKNTSNLKRWVADSEDYAKGEVIINEGARKALTESGKANSLLPVGITGVKGSFEKGDVVKITDDEGTFVGVGIAGYSSTVLKERIGEKNQKTFVHYDYFYLKA